MTQLLVGCPVRAREWILRPWFLFAEGAAEAAEMTPAYAFVIDTHDGVSEAIIRELCADRGRELYVVHVNEDGDRADRRVWNEDRYRHMVWLRNQLLALVRTIEPDWFLSLDSDILINEHALASMVEAAVTGGFDAVGGRCYMTPSGDWCPSYAMIINVSGLLRRDSDSVLPVDVIMAAKLMSPEAYGVDYQWHFHGEDVGWSIAARHKGLTLGWDGRVVSKHVMSPEWLEAVDPRCGY